jgi:hypothetical protein
MVKRSAASRGALGQTPNAPALYVRRAPAKSTPNRTEDRHEKTFVSIPVVRSLAQSHLRVRAGRGDNQRLRDRSERRGRRGCENHLRHLGRQASARGGHRRARAIHASLALRGAYYEGFRAPTLAERYRSFESPTFRGLSNPDLEEERLRGGDVGLDIRHGAFDGQVNYFYNHLRNFVGSAEVGFVDGKFTVMNTNVAKIRSRGVEMIGNLRLKEYLWLNGNYAYTDSEVVEGPFKGNQTEGAPRHVVSFALSYFAPFGLSLSPRGRWIDKAFQDITGEAPMDAHFVRD